jgi:hypothetical protein
MRIWSLASERVSTPSGGTATPSSFVERWTSSAPSASISRESSAVSSARIASAAPIIMFIMDWSASSAFNPNRSAGDPCFFRIDDAASSIDWRAFERDFPASPFSISFDSCG